ncbi:RhoGEF Guanine nucleotide exchange factor for Rho/Rac/Cdc42-like GTPase [Fulvivirga imtechensis AK7]|uniref:RhoGEF Guanine nucleotide exchange factor for Rho/Rac/Cdc42-like GTPase n=1 Tax=Fulvivirga imtechensis AK7 TaxID=1237149 RepID=L8JNM6_9BACT|nr:RhoGEF Guanine nucleotide exchange factor for Rho/Rac/Cdc42-like GTPase [Fulvivirga imtechensis]ELR69753.1 RhoGEF Guanine nucleotide exchange factor for Rho/Rac/Cdc42-like GTPase [Fulvivirga imtechensis AK7]
MDTHIKKFSAFIGIFILALGGSYAQNKEYDDLYFTSSDRNKVKKVKVENKVVQDADQVQQLDPNPQESYSSKTVNPEYIARYQAKSQEDYSSDSEYAEGEYFNENYQSPEDITTNFANNANYVTRDRYGNTHYSNNFNDIYWSDPMFYRGTIYDPFYRPYYGYRPWRSGWSVSIGFGNTWGWRNGWHSGFSMGYGWGWGWNSWYDPFYAYDPFYCPPYSRFGYGGYYGGYWGAPYRSVVVINNYESRSDRTFKRGPGMSRSGDVAVNSRNRRSTTSGSTGDISTGRSSTAGRTSADAPAGRYTSNSRDYSDTQSRYYRRSREAVNTTSSSDTQGRTYDSRSRSTSNYSTESNRSTSRSSSSYGRSYDNSRNGSYNNNSNSRSNSRSYSTPSRSNSNRYSSGNSSNSRSSGSYSSGSGSSSRSSGSYSSGSNSRSSGSSSRSSGSSRSSRRGGN